MFQSIAALALAVTDPGLLALQTADARVAAIGWRLQTANVALCTDTVPLAGFTVHSLAQYAPSARAKVAREYGLKDRPAVLAVIPGSPADRAGIAAGDEILAIDGQPTPPVILAKMSYDATGKTEAAIDAGLARPPMKLALAADGRSRAVEITGTTACSSRFQVLPSASLNASADGRYVQISGSMIDFANGDDELAVALAHEFAHNVLHHRTRLDDARVSQGMFAGFGKGGAALRQTEYEADRLGIWLMARAGYDIDAAVPFWTRIGQRTGAGIFSDRTHPSWKDRIARVAAAVAEVKAQAAAGKPLIPPSQQQIRR